MARSMNSRNEPESCEKRQELVDRTITMNGNDHGHAVMFLASGPQCENCDIFHMRG